MFSHLHLPLKRIVGTALIVFSLSTSAPLVAQNLSREQAQGLRKDADTAGKAIDQVSQNVTTPEARKAADTARSAVGRITDQLDTYIAQFEGAATTRITRWRRNTWAGVPRGY